MSTPNYDYSKAPEGAACVCGHPKEQHAYPGAGGTPCSECWCTAFRWLMGRSSKGGRG